MTDGVATLASIFSYIDLYGSRRRTAEVFIETVSGEHLTVRAGGVGVRSLPAGRPGPFEGYEVLVDHDPPRFWRRYSDESGGSLYAEVPRLLISHHIIRRGGIARVDWEVKEPVMGTFQMSIASTKDAGDSIWQALSGISNVSLVKSEFFPI